MEFPEGTTPADVVEYLNVPRDLAHLVIVNGVFVPPSERATRALADLDDVCVGCKVCTIACPFGTVNYNADTGKVIKCDLCGGDPECAKACPTGAITYVDIEQHGMDRMRAWAAQGVDPNRPQPGA